MVSFTFLLCSALVICGAIAAPFPGASSNAAPHAEVNAQLAAEIDKEAKQAAEKVLEDVVAGADVNKALEKHSIEASKNLMGEVASVVHSISKRLDELKRGDSIGDVAGRTWHAIQRKLARKNVAFDNIVKTLGSKNIQKFIEGTASIIKALIAPSVHNGQELKDIKGLDKASGEKLEELAKNVKPNPA